MASNRGEASGVVAAVDTDRSEADNAGDGGAVRGGAIHPGALEATAGEWISPYWSCSSASCWLAASVANSFNRSISEFSSASSSAKAGVTPVGG